MALSSATVNSWGQLSDDSSSDEFTGAAGVKDDGETDSAGSSFHEPEPVSESSAPHPAAPAPILRVNVDGCDRSRSRSPRRMANEIGLNSSNADPMLAAHTKFAIRSGIAWWAKPLIRAAMRSRCSAALMTNVPKRPMVHLSGCSGMLTEIIGAQVP
jgi:hypothetical protein